MADSDDEHNKERVLNIHDNSPVADAVPPKACHVRGQTFSESTRVFGRRYSFVQVFLDLSSLLPIHGQKLFHR